MGRRMDAVYVSAGVYLGALEIGGKNDNTKDFKDGYIKLPHVMKDQLKAIIDDHPSIMPDVAIVGYNI